MWASRRPGGLIAHSATRRCLLLLRSRAAASCLSHRHHLDAELACQSLHRSTARPPRWREEARRGGSSVGRQRASERLRISRTKPIYLRISDEEPLFDIDFTAAEQADLDRWHRAAAADGRALLSAAEGEAAIRGAPSQ
eukprot:Selendium_serpulae@DN2082_c0_g1_i1.p1